MIRIVYTLVFLFLGQNVLSFNSETLELAKDYACGLSSSEKKKQTEEIAAGYDLEFSAGFQINLHKIKIISRSCFGLYLVKGGPTENFTGRSQEVLPNLYIHKIIYPFHSFL